MLGPGIGGFEVVVIALVALIIVGPKDLPVLMRKVGQFLSRARKMAAEFRASFDDMARQSELDDLRKEVEALRSGQMDVIGKETSAAFKDIDRELKAPVLPAPAVKAVTETPPMTEPALPKPVVDEPAAAEAAPPAEAKPPRGRKPKSQPTVATKARTARRKADT